jgi:AraC-like DNA-binding protein
MAALASVRIDELSAGLADYPPGAVYGPRRQQHWQFVWMARGSAVWTVDGNDHDLGEGMVALSRPGMVDLFRWDGRGGARHGWIAFRADLPRDLPLTGDLHDGILMPLLRHGLALVQAGERGEQAQTVVRLALMAWASGRQALASLHGGEVGHPVVARALDRLRTLWAGGRLSQPSVPVLARHAGVSANHLIRLFRAELGATPQEAMRLMRLDHAADLLGTTDLPLHEVASRCAFADARHLARWFRLVFGVAPRAYRQRLAGGGEPVVIPLVFLRAQARRLRGG